MRSHLRNVRHKRSTGPAPFWGTLQNPEAHANGMSYDEAQAWSQREHAKIQAAQLAFQKTAAAEAQLKTDLRLTRELEDLRALALAAPPPVLAPEMSGVQQPMFSQAELDAANFIPVPHEYPAYGGVGVASADDASITPRRRSRPPSLTAPRKPGRKTLAEMSALERHARKCLVCRHRDREEIESDFLHWHDVSDIILEYKIPNRRALYRHARATGLYELRMANIRDAASLIAAKAEHCRATATSVLKAIQACSQIDELGRWIAPPTRTIRYTVLGEPQPAPQELAREAAPSHLLLTPDEHSTLTREPAPSRNPTTKSGSSNRHLLPLETHATSTKQSTDHISNRPKTPTFLNTLSRFFQPQNSAPKMDARRSQGAPSAHLL
jgi:hypothetical protein